MAKKGIGGNYTPEEKKWMKIMEPSMQRMVDNSNKIYCRLCGAPMIFDRGAYVDFEKRYQVHFECAQRHNAEVDKRMREQGRWK